MTEAVESFFVVVAVADYMSQASRQNPERDFDVLAVFADEENAKKFALEYKIDHDAAVAGFKEWDPDGEWDDRFDKKHSELSHRFGLLSGFCEGTTFVIYPVPRVIQRTRATQ